MNFLNLGLPEIIFIIIIALIIFGPNNMVKSAKDAGTFLRKVTKSPYWKEVWATKRDLDELPKMLAKEAHLDETIQELDRESRKISGSVSTAMKEMVQEANNAARSELESPPTSNHINPQETLVIKEKSSESQEIDAHSSDKV
jgi:Sec-independent protein translocase protein TatA